MLAGTRGGVAGSPGTRAVPAWISSDSAENGPGPGSGIRSAIGADKCYSTMYEHTGTISPGRPDRQGDIGQRGSRHPGRAAGPRRSAAAGPRAGRPARRQPGTVAAAYGDLRRRGLTAGAGRAGTHVRGAPPVSSRVYLSAPAGTRDLISGGPDPDLLPLLPARSASRSGRMYAEAPVAPRLRRLAAAQLAADGIDARSLTVTGGALDGIERVLATWLTPADRVIVEDPGHAVTFDLLAAMGFTVVPVPVDDLGIRPDALAGALARGAGALIVTPRAQAATGAAWDAGRAGEIREVLRRHPSAGVIEDDHAGPVAGVAVFSACTPAAGRPGSRARWVTLRSVSKSLGPDLRL